MKDFSPAVIVDLARKGISIYGTTVIPAEDFPFANGARAYKIDDNGCARIWTFSQVLKAAA